MNNKSINLIASKLTRAFLKNKIIPPIPVKYTKNIHTAQKFRRLCESKIKKPVIGFKAGGTAIPVLKKLKEKEPFYASVYSHNVLKNRQKVKVNKYTLGIELEVCYLKKKNFSILKKKITQKNINKFISYIAPCIEVVGYRQRKKGIKYLGDLSSDFGANVKFIIGKKKKTKNINVKNLKTTIYNNQTRKFISGNTNTVYKHPLYSLQFVLSKLKKDQVKLNKNFYVFTGSTVGVVPILNKGLYIGSVNKLGSVQTIIN